MNKNNTIHAICLFCTQMRCRAIAIEGQVHLHIVPRNIPKGRNAGGYSTSKLEKLKYSNSKLENPLAKQGN